MLIIYKILLLVLYVATSFGSAWVVTLIADFDTPPNGLELPRSFILWTGLWTLFLFIALDLVQGRGLGA